MTIRRQRHLLDTNFLSQIQSFKLFLIVKDFKLLRRHEINIGLWGKKCFRRLSFFFSWSSKYFSWFAQASIRAHSWLAKVWSRRENFFLFIPIIIALIINWGGSWNGHRGGALSHVHCRDTSVGQQAAMPEEHGTSGHPLLCLERDTRIPMG